MAAKMVTVLNNQNLLDIALQEFGNAKAAFDLCLSNGLNLTDEAIGLEVSIQANDYTDTTMLNFYNERHIKPATVNPALAPEGVGFDIVENTLYIR